MVGLAGGTLCAVVLGVSVGHVGCVDVEFADGQFLCDPAAGAEQCPDGQSCFVDGVCRSGNATPEDAGSGGTSAGGSSPGGTGPQDSGLQDTGTEDSCVPHTCLELLPSCAADLSDGCGQPLDCSGQCPSPSTCGGGSVAGQCGCPAVVSMFRWPTVATTLEFGQWNDPWSAPEEALEQDGVAARTLTLPSGHDTDWLKLKGFEPAVPDGATILGIVASIWVSTGATNDGKAIIRTKVLDFERDAPSGGVEHSVDLESDRAWPDYYDGNYDKQLDFGSDNQLWQLGWTVEQMNSPNLTLRIQGESVNGTADSSTATARVDYAELEVFYRPACPSF